MYHNAKKRNNRHVHLCNIRMAKLMPHSDLLLKGGFIFRCKTIFTPIQQFYYTYHERTELAKRHEKNKT
jgi:hypothetical protein